MAASPLPASSAACSMSTGAGKSCTRGGCCCIGCTCCNTASTSADVAEAATPQLSAVIGRQHATDLLRDKATQLWRTPPTTRAANNLLRSCMLCSSQSISLSVISQSVSESVSEPASHQPTADVEVVCWLAPRGRGPPAAAAAAAAAVCWLAPRGRGSPAAATGAAAAARSARFVSTRTRCSSGRRTV